MATNGAAPAGLPCTNPECAREKNTLNQDIKYQSLLILGCVTVANAPSQRAGCPHYQAAAENPAAKRATAAVPATGDATASPD